MPKLARMAERAVLLLSSSRVHGYGYLEHAKKEITNFFNKRNIKDVLFVPYALLDHDKYTDTVSAALSPWGYNVEGIHTKKDPVEAILGAQAIFVGGGNTFVLLKNLYDKNLIDPIREQVLKKGVPYVGSSAGTNVATRSINTTNDMPVVHPPSFVAMNLVPFNINPHYVETEVDTKHKGETRDERISEFLGYHKMPVLGLREGAAVLVEGDKAVLVGDRKAKLFRPDSEPIEYAPESDLSFLLSK